MNAALSRAIEGKIRARMQIAANKAEQLMNTILCQSVNGFAVILNEKYGKGSFVLTLKDSYYNMKEKIEPDHLYLIDLARSAMEEAGVKPEVVPIRGGTDGARLSYMGVPCPNLCAGGHNAHGKYEFVCIQSMENIVQLLIKIAEKFKDVKKNA